MDKLLLLTGIEKMTEKSPASAAHSEQQTLNPVPGGHAGVGEGTRSTQPEMRGSSTVEHEGSPSTEQRSDSRSDGQLQTESVGRQQDVDAAAAEATTASSAKASPLPAAAGDSNRPPLAKASSLVSYVLNVFNNVSEDCCFQ